MNIEMIINNLGLGEIISYTKIKGGRDSLVWRIATAQGIAYALRVLPKKRYQQFVREESILQMGSEHNIPVPKVIAVKRLDSCCVMLMEWVSGRTLFDELLENPEQAQKLGFEFGKTQSLIHQINPENMDTGTWFRPGTSEEKEIMHKIKLQSQHHSCLIHLDYHPLNVITDGSKITGVIDWMNASIGDYRFDVARTMSIFKFIGQEISNQIDPILNTFVKAWIKGYESRGKSIENLSLFHTWADLRTMRDLQM